MSTACPICAIVSIHAPGRGATEQAFLRELRHSFQFTHPGGVRLPAPQRTRASTRSFNSRTREGCDTDLPSRSNSLIQFQFTHPGGVRQRSNSRAPRSHRFNSRTREGCDHNSDAIIFWPTWFQFTHPGGVRHICEYRYSRFDIVSIHAPGRGATRAVSVNRAPRLVSIHAPGRGATFTRIRRN